MADSSSSLDKSPDTTTTTDPPPMSDSKPLEAGVLINTTTTSHPSSLHQPPDPVAERRVLRKFDLHLLPVLAIMYVFNSLDKSNLGNAKTAGLERSLHLSGNKYNLILSIFFIPYVLTAPMLGILGKNYGPSRVLPAMMFCFGLVTLLVVAVRNFAGLMAIRWFLGMSEVGLLPPRHLLPDHLLPPRRARTAAGHLLRRAVDRLGLWRPPRLWHLPHPHRAPWITGASTSSPSRAPALSPSPASPTGTCPAARPRPRS